MNMMLFEYEESLIIVDAGIMFPKHDLPGVDLVIPDFSYLRNPSKKILGLFLTHGHEDHIGAVPYLLREIPLPIYATPFTLSLLSRKLKEHRLPHPPQLISMTSKETVLLGPFSVEMIGVAHSIVESVALGITTPVGRLIHTGDFKIDSSSQDPLTPERFLGYGDAGVLALISDSTNAECPGQSHSESWLQDNLGPLFSEIKGRIILAMVSSNTDRLRLLCKTAQDHDRKVFLTGRKMTGTAALAETLGHLPYFLDHVTPMEFLPKTPDRRVIILTTGSQGEPMSGLCRIATGRHPTVQIRPSDTVILSARMIPGHEADIAKMINLLAKQGVRVLHERNAPVHVSGHASQEELKTMIEWVRPKFFIPVHGEYRQLAAHATLGRACGLPDHAIFVIHDGVTLSFTPGHCERGEEVPVDRIYVDGRGVGDVIPEVISERLQLGTEGVVTVTLSLDAGQIRSGPTVISRGLTANGQPFSDNMATVVRKIFLSLSVEERGSLETVETEIGKGLKKWIMRETGRHPVIIPNITLSSEKMCELRQ